jgi:hypothetical protein
VAGYLVQNQNDERKNTIVQIMEKLVHICTAGFVGPNTFF